MGTTKREHWTPVPLYELRSKETFFCTAPTRETVDSTLIPTHHRSKSAPEIAGYLRTRSRYLRARCVPARDERTGRVIPGRQAILVTPKNGTRRPILQ